MKWYYFLLRRLGLFIASIFFRWQVIGQEHIPATGGVLICANHRSYMDPIYITMAVTRQINFMAKEELFRIPLFGSLIRFLGAFPVKRGQSDLRSIRHALRLLQQGKVVLIFPEGTRNKTEQAVLPGLPGASMLALRSKATVLPLAICQYPTTLFSKILVKIGPAIDFSNYSEQRLSVAELANVSNEVIMKRIEHLIRHD